MTRNELVKTCGCDPKWTAATGGADDEATTRTTVRLASSKVEQTGGEVPALQEREAALNMARCRRKLVCWIGTVTRLLPVDVLVLQFHEDLTKMKKWALGADG